MRSTIKKNECMMQETQKHNLKNIGSDFYKTNPKLSESLRKIQVGNFYQTQVSNQGTFGMESKACARKTEMINSETDSEQENSDVSEKNFVYLRSKGEDCKSSQNKHLQNKCQSHEREQWSKNEMSPSLAILCKKGNSNSATKEFQNQKNYNSQLPKETGNVSEEKVPSLPLFSRLKSDNLFKFLTSKNSERLNDFNSYYPPIFSAKETNYATKESFTEKELSKYIDETTQSKEIKKGSSSQNSPVVAQEELTFREECKIERVSKVDLVRLKLANLTGKEQSKNTSVHNTVGQQKRLEENQMGDFLDSPDREKLREKRPNSIQSIKEGVSSSKGRHQQSGSLTQRQVRQHNPYMLPGSESLKSSTLNKERRAFVVSQNKNCTKEAYQNMQSPIDSIRTLTKSKGNSKREGLVYHESNSTSSRFCKNEGWETKDSSNKVQIPRSNSQGQDLHLTNAGNKQETKNSTNENRFNRELSMDKEMANERMNNNFDRFGFMSNIQSYFEGDAAHKPKGRDCKQLSIMERIGASRKSIQCQQFGSQQKQTNRLNGFSSHHEGVGRDVNALFQRMNELIEMKAICKIKLENFAQSLLEMKQGLCSLLNLQMEFNDKVIEKGLRSALFIRNTVQKMKSLDDFLMKVIGKQTELTENNFQIKKKLDMSLEKMELVAKAINDGSYAAVEAQCSQLEQLLHKFENECTFVDFNDKTSIQEKLNQILQILDAENSNKTKPKIRIDKKVAFRKIGNAQIANQSRRVTNDYETKKSNLVDLNDEVCDLVQNIRSKYRFIETTQDLEREVERIGQRSDSMSRGVLTSCFSMYKTNNYEKKISNHGVLDFPPLKSFKSRKLVTRFN